MIGCQRKEKWGVTANKYRLSFWGDGNVWKLDNGKGCTTKRLKTTELYTAKSEFYGMGTTAK